MKAAIHFSSLVTSGQLALPVRRQIAAVVEKAEGKWISITISEAAKKRSLRQNAFYFGVVLPLITEMFEEAGSDASSEEVHVFLKRDVGKMKRDVLLPDGTKQEIVTSSVQLSTQEWEDWLEKIRAWAAEYGVEVPFPNE